jgi:hypothetical protein
MNTDINSTEAQTINSGIYMLSTQIYKEFDENRINALYEDHTMGGEYKFAFGSSTNILDLAGMSLDEEEECS